MSRVVIEGPALAVTIEEDDQPDPKRRRPAAYVAPPPGRAMTWEQVVEMGRTNPYWTKEENDAADAKRRW
jgi:hypothetical protein